MFVNISRRQILKMGALSALASIDAFSASPVSPRPMIGIGMHSYGEQWGVAKKSPAAARFHDALSFLEYGHSIGAQGVQSAIGPATPETCRKLREATEKHSLYLEGQLSLPFTPASVERFEAEVTAAKEAGASVLRTACLSARRYEAFKTMQEFRDFADKATGALQRAEPILRRHGIRLAVENHKDWLIDEFLNLLKLLSSEYIGVCVDLGNSIALLEDPMQVVAAYAPNALSVHLKDIALATYDDGFLMSEVSLGEGMLDLAAMTAVLMKHNPQLRFNIEMITRDPLRIPCLTDGYWATFGKRPATDLVTALKFVKQHASNNPLPKVAGLSAQERLQFEDDNVRKCLANAPRTLGLQK